MKPLIDSDLKRFTNINSIQVPEELRVKHPTGIAWMDIALGGGYTATTATMITGSPGAGKSTLVRTVADALSGQGHQVLYNCGEESHFQVKMACDRLGLSNGFTIGNDTFVKDVITHANGLAKRCKANKKLFLMCDSLQTLDDQKYDTGKTTKRTPINCAIELIKWAKETGNVLVWVHQVTKNGVFVGDNQVLHAVDCHMHFGFDLDKKSDTYGERVLEIKKNRFAFNGAVEPMVLEMLDGGRLSRKVLAIPESVDDEEDLAHAAE